MCALVIISLKEKRTIYCIDVLGVGEEVEKKTPSVKKLEEYNLGNHEEARINCMTFKKASRSGFFRGLIDDLLNCSRFTVVLGIDRGSSGSCLAKSSK